ncbi:MAG: hypothetical protein RLZ62_23 [Bacteroidota bacterium]
MYRSYFKLCHFDTIFFRTNLKLLIRSIKGPFHIAKWPLYNLDYIRTPEYLLPVPHIEPECAKGNYENGREGNQIAESSLSGHELRLAAR